MSWTMQDERGFIDSVGVWRNAQTLTPLGRVKILQGYLEGLARRALYTGDMTQQDCRAHAEQRLRELAQLVRPELP